MPWLQSWDCLRDEHRYSWRIWNCYMWIKQKSPGSLANSVIIHSALFGEYLKKKKELFFTPLLTTYMENQMWSFNWMWQICGAKCPWHHHWQHFLLMLLSYGWCYNLTRPCLHTAYTATQSPGLLISFNDLSFAWFHSNLLTSKIIDIISIYHIIIVSHFKLEICAAISYLKI